MGAVITTIYIIALNLIVCYAAHTLSTIKAIIMPLVALPLAVFTMFLWSWFHPKPDETTKFCWKIGKKAHAKMIPILRKHSMHYGRESSQRLVEIVTSSSNPGNKAFAKSLGGILTT